MRDNVVICIKTLAFLKVSPKSVEHMYQNRCSMEHMLHFYDSKPDTPPKTSIFRDFKEREAELEREADAERSRERGADCRERGNQTSLFRIKQRDRENQRDIYR